MNIGNLKISGFAALAPMAGVADRAMREICREFGAAYTVGELTSAKGISLGDKKSASLLCCGEEERPYGSQIFGSDPETMALDHRYMPSSRQVPRGTFPAPHGRYVGDHKSPRYNP